MATETISIPIQTEIRIETPDIFLPEEMYELAEEAIAEHEAEQTKQEEKMTAEISGIEDLQLLTEGCDEVAVHTANALTCLCLALQAVSTENALATGHLVDAILEAKRAQFRLEEAKGG